MALAQKIIIPHPEIVQAAIDSVGTLVMGEFIQFLEDEWIANYYDVSSHSPSVNPAFERDWPYFL